MAGIWRRKRAKRDVWIVDCRDAAGVRHRLTTNTREQAEGLLADKITESREAPTAISADRDMTLSEYGARWLDAVATELKPRTVTSYRQLFRLHVEPALGTLKLRDIQRAHLKSLVTVKRQAGLSKNTVRLIRACLSAMLAEATDDGLLKANPAMSMSRRQGRKSADALSRSERLKAIRPMSEQQLAAMLMTAREDAEYFPLLLTLARTGVRPGEAMALKWEDLNLSERVISVERAVSAGQIGTTKTGHARRVDMSQELAGALSRLYVEREKETLRRGWPEIPQWCSSTARVGRSMRAGSASALAGS
jgi:integrase